MSKAPDFKIVRGQDGSTVRVPKNKRPKNKKRPRVTELNREAKNIRQMKHTVFRLKHAASKAERRKTLIEKLAEQDLAKLDALDQEEKIDWDRIGLDDPIPFTLTERGLEELRQIESTKGLDEVTNEGQHRITGGTSV